MRAIFTHSDHEKAITEKGYVVLKELVSDTVCAQLEAFFKENDIVDSRPFTISNWNNNEAYRNATFNKIVATLLPSAQQILDNYKPVLAVYTVKRPAADSDMLLHQDWSLVDETRYRSVSIWVALCDMDAANGNLQVAEYSHRYASFPRGMNVPVPFENIRDTMHERHLTALALKRGDAVVFDHRLIHASPANNSDKIRLAAVLALIPAEANLIHYYKSIDSEHELELLSMCEEDFKMIDFFDAPNKPANTGSLGKINVNFRQLTEEDILAEQVTLR